MSVTTFDLSVSTFRGPLNVITIESNVITLDWKWLRVMQYVPIPPVHFSVDRSPSCLQRRFLREPYISCTFTPQSHQGLRQKAWNYGTYWPRWNHNILDCLICCAVQPKDGTSLGWECFSECSHVRNWNLRHRWQRCCSRSALSLYRRRRKMQKFFLICYRWQRRGRRLVDFTRAGATGRNATFVQKWKLRWQQNPKVELPKDFAAISVWHTIASHVSSKVVANMEYRQGWCMRKTGVGYPIETSWMSSCTRHREFSVPSKRTHRHQWGGSQVFFPVLAFKDGIGEGRVHILSCRWRIL